MHSQPSDAKLEIKAAAAEPARAVIYRYLCKSATKIEVDGAGYKQHYFSDPARAEEFRNWLITQGISELWIAPIKGREKSGGDKKEKEYIIQLSPKSQERILLFPSTTVSQIRMTPAQIITDIERLKEAIIHNNIHDIDLIMRLMSEENQIALCDQYVLSHPTQGSLLSSLIRATVGKKDTARFIFINHCCSAALNKALITSVDGRTGLHEAVTRLRADAFQALMDKVSRETIDCALCMRTLNGTTPFILAIQSERPQVFCALVNKASPAVLNEVLSLQYENPTKSSTLHLLAYHQLGTPFITLLKKADSKVINSLLPLKDIHGNTGLHDAIRYQPSEAISLLIESVTPEALNQTCQLSNNYGNNILEYILSYHPPAVVAALLNKIDDASLIYMLRSKETPPQLLALIVNYLGHEPSWQTPSLVHRLIWLGAGPSLAKEFCRFWMAGKKLPAVVMLAAFPLVAELSHDQSADRELDEIYRIWKQELEPEEKKEVKLDVMSGIKLRSGKIIPIAADLKDEKALTSIAEAIWKEGIASVADYRLIQQRFPKTILSQVASDLSRAGLLYTGCFVRFRVEEYRIDPKLDQVIQVGDAIIKVVRSSRWKDFFDQISDYKHRPDDLRAKVDKTKITHKLVHLKNQIVAYVYHKPGEKEKKDPTHTKKMPGTAFSKQVTTSVFGEHDLTRELVAFVFDKKRVIIKAMESQDIGTHARGWVGSEETVEKYFERHKEVNFTDYESFRRWVDENPTRLNELLVKVSRESLSAITIVTDTKESRALARKYKAELKDRCKLDLPIFFYDRALREMRPYSQREQADDVTAEELKIPIFNSLRRSHDLIFRRRAILQYFSKKVEGSKYYFSSFGSVQAFLDWARAQSIPDAEKLVLERKEIKQVGPEKLVEYAVQLSIQQQDYFFHQAETKLDFKAYHSDRQIESLRDELEALIRKKSFFVGELDKLMRGILEQDLIKVLKLNDKPVHLLNFCGFHGNEETFIVFLNHCSASALSQTCLMPDKLNWTILHCVAVHFSGEAFCRLIDRMDHTSINQVLLMPPVTDPNHKGQTALHFVASMQSGHAFSALINKASAAAINHALNQELGFLTFYNIATKQIGTPFIDFINKADSKVLSQFVSRQQHDNGETGLHIVIRSQPRDAVSRLIELTTRESLAEACRTRILDVVGKNIFDAMFSYQPPEVIVQLLGKINSSTLEIMLSHSNSAEPAQVASLIKNYFSKEPDGLMQPLVMQLLAGLDNLNLAKCCCHLWFVGQDLPFAVRQALKPDFDRIAGAPPEVAAKIKEIQAAWKQPAETLQKESKDNLIHIQLCSGTTLTLSQDLKDEKEISTIAQKIWENGVKSFSDFLTIKKYFSNTSMSQAADALYQAGLLFSGCSVPFNQFVVSKRVLEIYAPPTIDPLRNQLRIKHERIRRLKTVYQYLSGSATVTEVSPQILQFKFENADKANQFLEWIEAQSLYNTESLAIEAKESKRESGCIVKLSKQQQEELLFRSRSITVTPEKVSTHSYLGTVVMMALRDQLNSRIWENSISKLDKYMQEIDEQALIKILKLTDKPEHLLNVCGSHGSEATFIVFLSHCSDSVLSQTCLLPDRFGWTILHCVAQHLPGEAFCRLIDRMDSALIDKALLMPPVTDDDYKGLTPLHFAASHQPGHAFSALINKASAAAINQACLVWDNKGKSFFDIAFSHQSPKIMVELLNKIDDKSLASLFMSPDMADRVISLIKNYLSKESTWPQPLVTRLLKHLSAMQIAECYYHLWLSGQDFPSKVMQEQKPDFDGLVSEQPARAAEFKEIQATWGQKYKEESKDGLIRIQLGSGTPIILPKDLKDETSIAKDIWEKGIKFLNDLHIIKKYFPNTLIFHVVDDLYQAGLLFSGCRVPFDQYVPPVKPVVPIDAPLIVELRQVNANPWRAKHDRIITAQAIYRHLTDFATAKKLDLQTLQFRFNDPARANEFLVWIKAQSLSNSQNLKIEEIEQKGNASKEYIVKLSTEQQAQLLLRPITGTPEKVLSSFERVLLRDELVGLIMKNSFEKLDARMREVDESTLVKILKLDYEYGHLLYASGYHGNETTFIVFLSHCSDSVLSQTCLLPDKSGWTILHCVAQKLPGKAFCMLIERMDPTFIDKALLMPPVTSRAYKGLTALHFAAEHQPGNAFSLLIHKTSAATINQVFSQSSGGSTFLQIAIKQIGAPFIDVLNKANSKVISPFLLKKDAEGETILHRIMSLQPKNAVSALIALATPESLDAACLVLNKNGKSIFDTAFSHQPPEVMVQLLNKMGDGSLECLFNSRDVAAQIISLLKNHLSKEPGWPQPLVARLLKNLSAIQIAECYCQLWLSGRSLPQEMKPDFAGLIRTQPVHADRLNEIQVAWAQERKDESKEALVQIKLYSGKPLSIAKDEKEFTDIAKTIWEEGLASLSDLHTLKKYFSNTILSPMVDKLDRAGLLFSGCYAPFDPPAVSLPQIDVRLKIEPIFAARDKAAKELRVIHKTNTMIKVYIERLNALAETIPSSESKDWMTKFQEKFTGVAPAITRSAAIKMSHLLLDGKSKVLTNDELLALRAGPLGKIVSEIEQDELLPKEVIEQEERGIVARRGFGGHQ